MADYRALFMACPSPSRINITFRGMQTTMGYVGWIDAAKGDSPFYLTHHAESEIVRELEALGAVVIAKVTGI